MHVEVSVALNFIISYLYNKLPRRRVDMFGHELEKRMKTKFNGHWYPERPNKGSAYRCIRVNGEKVDPDIEKAVYGSGLEIGEVRSYLPADLTLWIDPSEVSYRLSEKGTVKILYSDKKDDELLDTVDHEVQAANKGFNPEAQCFKPIDSVSSSLSSLSLSPSSPTSPAGWSTAASPSTTLFNSAASTNMSTVGNQAPGSTTVTVVHAPSPEVVSTTVAAISNLSISNNNNNNINNHNNNNNNNDNNNNNNNNSTNTTSNNANNSSNTNISTAAASVSPSATVPSCQLSSPVITSATPVIASRPTSFLTKPNLTSPQFTASSFAQTKFGSTKLKSQVKRPTRLSPIEFRNYFRQRAAGSSLQSSPVTPTGGSLIGPAPQTNVPAVGVSPTLANSALRVGMGFGHPSPGSSAPGTTLATRPRSLSPRDPRIEFLFEQHHQQPQQQQVQHPHHRYMASVNQKPIVASQSTLLSPVPSHDVTATSPLPHHQQLNQTLLQPGNSQTQPHQSSPQPPLPSPSSTGLTLRDFYQSPLSNPFQLSPAHGSLPFTDFMPNTLSPSNPLLPDSRKSFIEALSNIGNPAYNNQFHHLLVAN
ncbi:phosphatidylinositol 3-kinase 2 [Octopus bimaculoides]|uniref:Anti-proliferative protein domain-containing protein n=1 Tax=Octopus bimaculoides TaxID=37653 RepID=A0A0L8FXE8_OCTBM|nr:phosphatidylinositol 3-kinase 2 [Octopus bimaculoides]|eukprot:XP_014786103.1 PREDICTED: phosphatidylinositol 3-kinase 2-like [Octopus bimaculoides]